MQTLNLGILAHVDAGKTSLTERFLYAAGAIDQLGSVDAGSTQTDTLDLERQRGITIKSAVASFQVDGVTVNLIDTPGHPDFIAEVERVLRVLDGVVLVVSAVEGVQAQTRVLMRALQRLGLPTLIFLNKIDRTGADVDRVLHELSSRLTPAVIAMGEVSEQGTRAAAFAPYADTDAGFVTHLVEVLADRDGELLDAYLSDGASISPHRVRGALATQTRRAQVHPVFCGSAITGAGVAELTAALTELLPTTHAKVDGPLSGVVFKVERGPAGERIAYVRMFSGTMRVRDRIALTGAAERKVTAVSVVDAGSVARESAVCAGQIAKVWGLGDVRIGDPIGEHRLHAGANHFAPPTLEAVIAPQRPQDSGRLHVALTALGEQDPLINVRSDEARHETLLSLYGEVQKEVIRDTLMHDFGVDVDFRESTTVCIERPVGSGTAAVQIAPEGRTAAQPFLAGVGLRIDPAPVDSGVSFELEIERGALPRAFLSAIEESVPVALLHGNFGWQVTDCTVTLTYSAYWPRQSHAHATFDKAMSSTAGDFRRVTPLVLLRALRHAGTQVYQPVQRFQLELPLDALSAALVALAKLQAVSGAAVAHGTECTLEGEIPAARVHELQQQLPQLTSGEGVLETAFSAYQAVRGPMPRRSRPG